MGDAYVASFGSSNYGSNYKPPSKLVAMWAYCLGGVAVSNDPRDGWLFPTIQLAHDAFHKIWEVLPDRRPYLSVKDDVVRFRGC